VLVTTTVISQKNFHTGGGVVYRGVLFSYYMPYGVGIKINLK